MCQKVDKNPGCPVDFLVDLILVASNSILGALALTMVSRTLARDGRSSVTPASAVVVAAKGSNAHRVKCALRRAVESQSRARRTMVTALLLVRLEPRRGYLL